MANYNSQYTGEQIDAAVGAVIGGRTGGLSNEAKQALLECFQNVAWANTNGQIYYDALYDALYSSVTLVSISVAYTQSGTVYDTDTLDDLKSDLVVIAHYDDATTETISAYVLTGELTIGTSTITVVYRGKIATFDVIVSPDLSAYAHVWDLTSSLVDSVGNVTATLGDSTTQDSSGVHITGASQYIAFPDVFIKGYSYEVDIVSFNKQSTDHNRLFSWYDSSGFFSSGFIYRSTGVWAVYGMGLGGWGDTDITDPTYVNGKTLKLNWATNGDADIYLDGVLLLSGSLSGRNTSTGNWSTFNIGSPSGLSAYNLTISGVRIKQL